MLKLSKTQQKAFNIFDVRGMDVDVPIATIYRVLYGKHVDDVRAMQQTLGPLIARINAKLKATKIVPGQLKQTYRITRIAKD